MSILRLSTAFFAPALAFALVGGGHAADTPPLAWAPVQSSTQAPLQSSDAKVEAVRDATLAAQVAGSIVALRVHAGDRVKAGQELLRIDARMAAQGAAASSAQVAAAQAQAAVATKEYERQQQPLAFRQKLHQPGGAGQRPCAVAGEPGAGQGAAGAGWCGRHANRPARGAGAV